MSYDDNMYISGENLDALAQYALEQYGINDFYKGYIVSLLEGFVEGAGAAADRRSEGQLPEPDEGSDPYDWREKLERAASGWDQTDRVVHVKSLVFHLVLQFFISGASAIGIILSNAPGGSIVLPALITLASVIKGHKEYFIRITNDESCVFLNITHQTWEKGFTQDMIFSQMLHPGQRCENHSSIWICRHCKNDLCYIAEKDIRAVLESLQSKNILRIQDKRYYLAWIVSPQQLRLLYKGRAGYAEE